MRKNSITYGTKARPKYWKSLKASVIARDHRVCRKCNSRVGLEVHHIVALAEGGSSNIDNLVTLCRACHLIETRLLKQRLAGKPVIGTDGLPIPISEVHRGRALLFGVTLSLKHYNDYDDLRERYQRY